MIEKIINYVFIILILTALLIAIIGMLFDLKNDIVYEIEANNVEDIISEMNSNEMFDRRYGHDVRIGDDVYLAKYATGVKWRLNKL